MGKIPETKAVRLEEVVVKLKVSRWNGQGRWIESFRFQKSRSTTDF